jgi:hypothetical protein
VVQHGWTIRVAAQAADVSEETGAKWVARYRAEGELGRLGSEPAQRRARASRELIYVDVKKLGRIVGGAGKRARGGANHDTGSFSHAAGKRRGKAGRGYVHIAIDDATRLAYTKVLVNERASIAVAFPRRALAFCARHGITVDA